MNTPLFRFVAGLALVGLGGGRATAQVVVNIDFGDLNKTYVGQGVYSDSGHNYWNSITDSNIASPGVLKASDGVTTTGITFALANYEDESEASVDLSAGGAPGPVASDLMRDYLYAFGDSSHRSSFTIGGLSADQTYDIYIYSAVGGNNAVRDRQAVFTLDGQTQGVNGYSSATQGGALYSTFVEGDNYLMFTVTPTGTTIDGNFYAPAGGEAEFNGFQIVQPGAAIPEPATYAAMAGVVALAATLAVRRRRS